MNWRGRCFWGVAFAGLLAGACPGVASAAPEGIVGSQNCRECHERFYELWSTSMHGLAMRRYDDAFAARALTPQGEPILVDGISYSAHTGPGEGFIRATGPAGDKDYPIAYTLGGKNVFFLLTPLARGRLQTLPLAYDVKRKAWIDMAAGGVRHASAAPEHALPWTDSLYTFNTGCYGCHVSQLATNYDAASDTYRTTWSEPGINCETCHGPGEAHAQTCREAGNFGDMILNSSSQLSFVSPKLPELKLTLVHRKRGFSAEQVNASCGGCHAKALPITAAFVPGDEFAQHYDIVTLEDPDFYPDGRELGENYTYAGWMMNRCTVLKFTGC